MNKANDMQVDQTNNLLSQVEGLSFKIPGLAEDKQPGAAPKSKGVDPESLMVEDTNEKLSAIIGPAWDGMNKSSKSGAKPLTEGAAVVSMGNPTPVAQNPILPSQKAGVIEHNAPPAAPAQIESEQLTEDVQKVKTACGLIEQAKAALAGVEGFEDICEELDEIAEDLEDAIEDEE